MARPDPDPSDPRFCSFDTGNPFEPQIRSGLHLAFPLPAGGEAADDCFRRLLEALARQRQARS